MIIVKFDNEYSVEFILEITWDTFMKFKFVNSRMKTYSLNITRALVEEGKAVYQAN